MWHKQNNKNPIVRLALLLALASTFRMTSFLKSDYALAQSSTETPSFALPTEVPSGTTIRVDGSASMTRANEALKERFEKEYSGTNVELASNGTDDALKAVQEGKVDIAAIGRGLTPSEENQGLSQQRLRREKIAIVVGKDNPYKGDLTNQQFTRIYRGEITDWSEIGGPSGKIRVIDRPELSDTRQAFRNYPLFNGDLTTGSTATQLDSDDPAEVVKQLGDDGIGFVLANQVSKLDNVRVLSMHKTLPDNPKYPYSQPLVYVFKKNPSVAVQNFVGFATAAPGKEAIEEAREQEAAAVAQTVAQALSGDENTTGVVTPTPGATEAATNGTVTENVGSATNTSAKGSSATGDQAFVPSQTAGESTVARIPWYWFLLPVAALGALILWWLLGRRKAQEDDTVARGVLPKDSPPPFTPTSTSTSGAVKEPVTNTPGEPTAGINTATAPVEPAANTTPGINAAGIAAGAAGLGLGAAALGSRDREDTSNVSENPGDETDSQLRLDAPAKEQPDIYNRGLDIEASDLQEADIVDTGFDLEAPAAVVNSSHHSLPRISTPIDIDEEATPVNEPVAFEEVDNDTSAEEYKAYPQEELPSASATSKWLGNFALGGAAAAGAARIKSKLASKDVPESDNSEKVNQPPQPEETIEVDGTTQYAQLPDVWETPLTQRSRSDDNNTSEAYSDATAVEDHNTEENSVEQEQVSQSPSDLWGNPETEVLSNSEPSTNFPYGIAAAGAAALGGIAAISSGLFNKEKSDGQENSVEEQEQETENSASNLWGNPETQPTSTDEQSNATGVGGFALGENIPSQSDRTKSPIAEEQEQTGVESPSVATPGLPEVRIIPSNEQLADAQTTSSNIEPTTPEETTTDQKVAQFGALSNSGENPVSVGGAVLAAGAFTLGGKILDGNEEYEEQEENDDDKPSASQVSFGADVALDRIADEAEADTELPPIEQDSDEKESEWDRIYGIHHNGGTGVPGESNIFLANRTPKWAYASWNIAADSREAMQNRGATQLVLRLYDVTNIDLSYQSAKLVQQYECEETVSHRYVAIPNTDRDYIAEIGYLTQEKEWLLVSRSPIVRVFSRPHKDFWFEADAELIIHGATEPGSTVTIDGHSIKVKQDGTFHLRVPFTESLINYLITAVAPDSEQARTIHMQFSQKERKNS
jgi:phosphate transport system substrate-binding protein